MTFFDIADMSPPDDIEPELSAESDFIVPVLPDAIVSLVADDELPDPEASAEPEAIAPF